MGGLREHLLNTSLLKWLKDSIKVTFQVKIKIKLFSESEVTDK